ncbi:MAG: hypothetical protein KAS69_05980 [Planctomycetes bacterium]|nr:hypothetical protein [Planctomycetota bacterium]
MNSVMVVFNLFLVFGILMCAFPKCTFAAAELKPVTSDNVMSIEVSDEVAGKAAKKNYWR